MAKLLELLVSVVRIKGHTITKIEMQVNQAEGLILPT